jgi:AcrR family transcriptional regulator
LEHKQNTRASILRSAGRLFRAEGYGGSGIDRLTKAAGVTNGAFYRHFGSKSEAFRETVLAGLRELREGIAKFRTSKNRRWLAEFFDFYLGPKRTCDLAEACALPTLSPEVMRADEETRTYYQAELQEIVAELAMGLSGKITSEREDQAIAILALLSGGVTLARAVPDPDLSARIARAVRQNVEKFL